MLAFKMRQLPKQEYRLMKMLIDKYSLQDPSELFTCLLRLTHEVLSQPQGNQWFVNVINQYRSDPKEEREYSLE